MRQKYGAEEARQQLPSLLAAAHAGRATIITRHGRDYAAIVPVEQLAMARPHLSLLSLRGTGAGMWGPSDTVARQRDDWR